LDHAVKAMLNSNQNPLKAGFNKEITIWVGV